ncbi:MAG: hypothetical protein JJW01_00515 [Alphaproteobacteria bacterium]|nr:hypothetical protein [Rickettsiales bacterium]
MSYQVGTESRVRTILVSLKGVAGVIWPYVAIQLVLRILLFCFAAKRFFSYKILLVPLSLAIGSMYDIIVAAHIALFLFALIAIIPIELRKSIIGKIGLLFFVTTVSAFVVLVFWLELFVWLKSGDRLYYDFTIYISEVVSYVFKFNRSYGWYIVVLLFIILICAPSIAFSRVVKRYNMSFTNSDYTPYLDVTSVKYLLISLAFLFSLDIYNSRFDITSVFGGYNINSVNNKYVINLSKNGLYELFARKFAVIWKFEDRYVSFPTSQDRIRRALVENVNNEKNVFFVGGDSDFKSDLGAKVFKLKDSDRRPNMIIVQLDNLNCINHFNGVRFKSMAYLSSLVDSSLVFSRAFAMSNRKSESLFSMLFSVVPINADKSLSGSGSLFSFPNILKGQGYSVKAFTNKSLEKIEDIDIFYRSGFELNYLESLYRNVDELPQLNNGKSGRSVNFNGNVGDESIELLARVITKKALHDFKNGNNFVYYISSNLFSTSSGSVSPNTVDGNIMHLLNVIKKEDCLRDTIVVFIGSSGKVNATSLFISPDLNKIPWIIVNSKEEPRTIGALVSHLDFAPTLLSLLNIGYISKFQGINVTSDPSYFSNRGIVIKNRDLFGYFNESKMFVLAPYKRFFVYTTGYESSNNGVISNVVIVRNETWLPDGSLNSFAERRKLYGLLTNSNDNKFTLGICDKCLYTTVSIDESDIGWSCGKPYSRLISKHILKKKKKRLSEKQVEFSFMEAVAFLQNNVAAGKAMGSIDYNMINDDDFS